MEALNFTCQGASHIATGKVCQDYSYSMIYEDGLAIAVVCDGHGGKRYFRSQYGAGLAGEIAEEKIRAFVMEGAESLLKGVPFGQIASISTQIEMNDFTKESKIERAFRQLAASIIFEWNHEIGLNASRHPLLDSEKEGLEQAWINEFDSGANLEKAYGCTLIACAFTPDYWFAFQIGDGKCFALDESGVWSEPIPWDDRCFLNTTTSICDEDAVSEFRFCYQGDGGRPLAMILGSDGIDDSLGIPQNQANFYVQIIKSIVTGGKEATEKELETTLAQLSQMGSKDDISIAMVYDEGRLPCMYPKLIAWQLSNLETDIAEEEEKITKYLEIQKAFESKQNLSNLERIQLEYAIGEGKAAMISKERCEQRMRRLLEERERALMVSLEQRMEGEENVTRK